MNITREKLENQQIWIYGISLLFGGILGISNEDLGKGLDWAISPLIAILMYGMFAQIPFLKLREAISNLRFMAALLIGNFIAVPIIVWILTMIFPQSPPILLGVCLVLLTPCIDYVIVFTQLGKGNEKLMLASTPILFVVQMILLPLYLWLFIGEEMGGVVHIEPFLEAFLLLIVTPLILAIITQLWAKKTALGEKVLDITTWFPVPFMALVLIVVVTSQIGKVYSDFEIIVRVIPIYILFLIITPFISRFIAFVFKLDIGAGRALIFSTGTRNSLVVLPLALALPDSWATLAAAVIVTQTIVELIGELFYIKAIPKLILKDHTDYKEGL
ncbi:MULTISPECIES: arsenic resistance protein [Bacillaceae]|uniref:Arsenic resistance protein n=1 Tax=Niallia circulans TaxID=1397 RepID=A0A941JIH5_NIACI|nr:MULTISPECIES: bile acid:sodium symporter [Bacillaceae]MDU1847518.1 bile acid:sodium symporter [Niallia nealsonii]SLL35158.1 arsenical-resistance protein [Mycobacteroides abscessus subsp. abscessus]HEO8421330.1 arsenic resistance protein [Yersinia enterocolitica]KAB7670389.1 arsenic resistance protein [Bacillus sp. B1-b2]MCB5237056.1 bile acid:sodium symporter [Niallia circulans]